MNSRQMRIPVTIHMRETVGQAQALIDSGAQGKFINREFARKLGLREIPLPRPINVYNVDGTPNKLGTVTSSVRGVIQVGDDLLPTQLLVTHIGKHDLLLGIDWLRKVNPVIDWQQGTLRIKKPEQRIINSVTIEDEPDNEGQATNPLPYDDPTIICPADPTSLFSNISTEWIQSISDIQDDEWVAGYIPGESQLYVSPLDLWINAKINPAMVLAQGKTDNSTELPPEYAEFKDVFEKKAAERFPTSRPYDHAIELKEGFIPRDCKVYPMSPKEQQLMHEFLEENLRKGYIRPSKSPMASPFFFVGKKTGDMRPCQDYRYLNE